MAKRYELPEEESCMVSEAVLAYRTNVAAHGIVEDVAPCTYTDDEFKEELLLSEVSGFVSNEDFKKSCFEKWGVAL